MNRYGWLALGLALTLATGRDAAAREKPKALGVGPAYETLAKVPLMHAGRIKPLDTLAREEVKQIFGRETIKLHDAANKVVATWAPVAALFDWSSRPEFWDDQSFLLVEYLPLKRLLLADTIETRLTAIADKPGTAPADGAALKALAGRKDTLSAGDLTAFLGGSKVTGPDRDALSTLAGALGEEHRWLSPRELEQARVTVDGQRTDFNTWFRGLVQKKRKADGAMGGGYGPKLTDLEKRAIEAGTRLIHYQALRDREVRSVEPLLVMPRPSNEQALAFIAKAIKKGRDEGPEALSPLQLDMANALATYYHDIPDADRAIPGEDREFDRKFSDWLTTNAVWVPLSVLLKTKPDEMAAAGYPAQQAEAFRTAFESLDKAEADAPGTVGPEKTAALLAAARSLGETVNPTTYPTPRAMDREASFNETNPFWKAPMGYGLALAALAMSLGFLGTARRSPLWWVGRACYVVGMLGLVSGIALEVLGFAQRVQISGWAPVTNMYETVIWVSLVAAVLGLVFELIFRRGFPALAGSGVALLGTVLAANVPLLDPSIHSLQPVLRSNYWLTIHVLTEVSSYAAFALAMGLGLIATFYYLTATYRRSPSFGELAWPAVPGLPMLAAGAAGLAASQGSFGLSLTTDTATKVYYVSALLAAVGGVGSIVGIVGILGEAIARATFRSEPDLDEAALAGSGTEPSGHAATSVQTVTVGEGNGAVATLTRPTVAEIRAIAAQTRPKLDARGRAMQATAAQIKPLSNFIYRTMQVGVLLITAGTILGGVWADDSWGRFWGWDPKEVWALITLLVYLIPLHGRFAGWFNTFALVMASVVCFLSVIMAWYGVNFVLGVGLHSYGFVEGGSQGVVGAVVLSVLAVAAAAAWRRNLASRLAA